MRWVFQRFREDILTKRHVRRDLYFYARDTESEMAHLAVGVRQAGSLGFLRLRLAGVLVLVVANVLGRSAALMAAIPRRSCKGELHR